MTALLVKQKGELHSALPRNAVTGFRVCVSCRVVVAGRPAVASPEAEVGRDHLHNTRTTLHVPRNATTLYHIPRTLLATDGVLRYVGLYTPLYGMVLYVEVVYPAWCRRHCLTPQTQCYGRHTRVSRWVVVVVEGMDAGHSAPGRRTCSPVSAGATQTRAMSSSVFRTPPSPSAAPSLLHLTLPSVTRGCPPPWPLGNCRR